MVNENPKKIWLEPACSQNGTEWEGRNWCEDDVWGECDDCGLPSVEYTRSDIAWNEALEQLTEKGIGAAALEAAFQALPPDADGTMGAGEMERVILAAISAMKRIEEEIKR